jgi:transposase
MSNRISLSKAEREELTQRVSSQSGRADDARRARLVLLLDAGHTWAVIRDKLDCTDSFIDRWGKRFVQERLAGLFSRHAGQVPTTLTPLVEARILEWSVKRKPSDGSTHWSSRKLGAQLHVSHMMIARVWRKHALRPHRCEGYIASNDPDFEVKAADILGLYLHPPQHAAVFSVDEKSAIQALDRKDPVLPLSPGRAERHGFEYYRHGTLSLPPDTHPRNSSPSSPISSPISPAAKKSMSSLTTFRLTKVSRSRTSLKTIRRFIFISLRPTPHGSTRSSFGLPRSNETSSPAAYLLPFPTSNENSCAISVSTTGIRKP